MKNNSSAPQPNNVHHSNPTKEKIGLSSNNTLCDQTLKNFSIMVAEDRQAFQDYFSVVIENNFKENEKAKKILNILKEPEEITLTEPTQKDFSSFDWQPKESAKSNYEQIQNNNTEAFRILQNWISAHNGFANLYCYKIWFHLNDENIIDRRKQVQ